MVKIVKNPGNGGLNNLNDPFLNVLTYISYIIYHIIYKKRYLLRRLSTPQHNLQNLTSHILLFCTPKPRMAFGNNSYDMGSTAEDEDGHRIKLTTYPKQWTGHSDLMCTLT